MSLTNYSVVREAPTAAEFCLLRSLVGWGQADIDVAQSSLDNSLFHVVVRDGAKLLGMARVVGDGFMYFYVQDVIVDPACQKLGIGDVLMQEIESYLSATAAKGATIGLLAAKGKEPFYSRFGYLTRPSDSLGNGMCKFV